MLSSTHRPLLALLAAPLLALPLPSRALAGGTRSFEVHGFDDLDKGEVEGAAIESSGRITVGLTTAATKLQATTAFSCAAAGKQAYVGTSDDATLVRVRLSRSAKAPSVETVAKLPGVVVSAILPLPSGDILAATLPGGVIHRVSPRGKVSTFAKVDAKQIWALARHEGRILVATGPDGKLFSLDRSGKGAKVILDSDESHLMALAVVSGRVLVGTAPRAKLLMVDKAPEGVLLQDFSGDELRAMAVAGTNLVVATNAFESRGISSVGSLTKQLNRTSLVGQPPTGSASLGGSGGAPKATAKVRAVDLGKRLDPLRAMESPWEIWLRRSKQYFTDLAVDGSTGAVLVASSRDGKVYRVRSLREVSTVADLDERQVTALCPFDRGNVLATTSGGATVTRLRVTPASEARYVSHVLDAKRPAKFGAIRLGGVGPVRVRARVGPSEEPDDHWSAWREIPVRAAPDGLRGTLGALPERRYLQIEMRLAGPAAELRRWEAFYTPENLAPLIESIDVSPPDFDSDDDDEPSAKVTIKWKAKARDDDDLVYEVRVRPEGANDSAWIRLDDPDDPLTERKLKWDVATVPDGIYEVQVRASDEPSNGAPSSRADTLVSDPVVVDRGRPTIGTVRAKGRTIRAKAQDALSRIHDVAYSVDGGPFRTASAVDGILDGPDEDFEVQLPKDLAPGRHRVVLRARDERGNMSTVALVVDL